MRILVLHQYYLAQDEAGISRFNEFCRYWSQAGAKITVLAGMVNYMTGKKRPEYKGKFFYREQNSAGIKVWRCHVSEKYNNSFLGRLWAYFSFVFSSLIAGLFLTGKQDLVLVTSPPLFIGITGYVLARFKNAHFVFEVRDLWPESAIATGVVRNSFLIKLAYWLEDFFYRQADLINVLTPAFRDNLVNQKNVLAKKIVMIPNGADLNLFSPGSRNNWVRNQYGWQNKFVVIYIGAHGVANNLVQIIKAARLLKKHSEILLVLIGDGMEKPKLLKLTKKWRLTNVKFLNLQPKNLIKDFINASDACLAVLAKRGVFKTVYPNKVFDYMACAKPIILGIDGIARDLVVNQAKAGVYVEPENYQALTQSVLDFKQHPEKLAIFGQAGYDFVKVNFSREVLAKKYLTELKKLI